MKALVLNTATGKLQLEDRPEPAIQNPDEIKLRVHEVGICGTDRDEVKGAGRALPPPDSQELIIGHEMIGEVVEIGSSVKSVKPGDFATFTVRRGCNHCSSCKKGRSDLCYTGEYTERGIKGKNGYQAQFVVDKEAFIVPIPSHMRSFGVLCEPTSVIEKAIDDVIRIQINRLVDWPASNPLQGRIALVAGMGPVGLLASMALRLRGAEVIGIDIVGSDSPRPRLLRNMGGTYLDVRQVHVSDIPKLYDAPDIIVEAAGVTSLDFKLWQILGVNGAYVLTGVTPPSQQVQIDGGDLMQELVFHNQVVVGSVNAAKAHWQQGVKDLEEANKAWPGVIEQIITHRFSFAQFENALLSHPQDEIKTVISWTSS
ncbi:glucose 1-dehydrogenase [Candidatus Protochlamydia phocaeensis]|uniref:glucose 1-dehydrogenase n=1 Tax=Candidatus Protochlamydia phocaeensis TaxID=1414722 RepID=UPI000837E75F|nr:glucose 1-dehydrogenase [Candidatus Protochlamydia phocaeensis]